MVFILADQRPGLQCGQQNSETNELPVLKEHTFRVEHYV